MVYIWGIKTCFSLIHRHKHVCMETKRPKNNEKIAVESDFQFEFEHHIHIGGNLKYIPKQVGCLFAHRLRSMWTAAIAVTHTKTHTWMSETKQANIYRLYEQAELYGRKKRVQFCCCWHFKYKYQSAWSGAEHNFDCSNKPSKRRRKKILKISRKKCWHKATT